jgi:hypothetical protein
MSGSLSKEPGHTGENVLACCSNYTASELLVNRTFGQAALRAQEFRTCGLSGRIARKKKPVRKRAKGRIRFGLSLDEKKPRYGEVVKFF